MSFIVSLIYFLKRILFLISGATECARAVFEHMIDEMPQRQSVWREAAAFEKKYGTV